MLALSTPVLPPAAWAAGLAALLLCALIAGARLERARGRRRIRRRQRRALAGERDAEALLHAFGYEIEQRQAPGQWSFEIDGHLVDVDLRADFLVRRAGRLYVAEVKTGAEAPSPQTASTRRQLLEYSLAYPVAGSLLVDMEAGTISEVRFPEARAAFAAPLAPNSYPALGAVAVLALAGVTLLWALTR